jgi:hypothetical protein
MGKYWASIVIFKKLPKALNLLIGENSPNLVTLRAICIQDYIFSKIEVA